MLSENNGQSADILFGRRDYKQFITFTQSHFGSRNTHFTVTPQPGYNKFMRSKMCYITNASSVYSRIGYLETYDISLVLMLFIRIRKVGRTNEYLAYKRYCQDNSYDA